MHSLRHVPRTLLSTTKPNSTFGLHKNVFVSRRPYSQATPSEPCPLSEEDFPVVMAPLRPYFGPSGLPALPKLKPLTLERTMTHKSVHARRAHGFEGSEAEPLVDNEQFELVGDSILNFVTTSIILEVYPQLQVGPFTKMRGLIVENDTIANISRMYGLHEQLRLHPSQAITLRCSPRLQADVFEVRPPFHLMMSSEEIGDHASTMIRVRACVMAWLSLSPVAYIGGLFIEQGMDAVQKWLRPLLKPYVVEAYAQIRAVHGLRKNVPGPQPPLILPHEPVRPGPIAIAIPMANLALDDTSGSDTPPTHLEDNTPHGYLGLFNQYTTQQKLIIEWKYELHHGDPNPTSSDIGPGAIGTPIWTAKAAQGKTIIGRGQGRTKKIAQNIAAREALKYLEVDVYGY